MDKKIITRNLYKSTIFFKGLGWIVIRLGEMVKKTVGSTPRDSENAIGISESLS